MQGVRRIKRLTVTPRALFDLFMNREPITLSFSGLPSDARYWGGSYDPLSDCFQLAIESDTFPEVPEGTILEPLYVTVTQHWPAVLQK